MLILIKKFNMENTEHILKYTNVYVYWMVHKTSIFISGLYDKYIWFVKTFYYLELLVKE